MSGDRSCESRSAENWLDVEQATASLDASVSEPLLAVGAALTVELANWRSATGLLNERLSTARSRSAMELAARVERGPRARLAVVAALLASLQPASSGNADRLARAVHLVQRADWGLANSSIGAYVDIASPQDLSRAVEELARSLECPVSVRVDVASASALALSVVYFTCAEAITNVAKHAQARAVTVEVTTIETSVSVRVVDDGCGGADLRGAGLQGLVRRVESVGGSFTLTSSEAQGTEVHARVPR